MKSFNFLNNLVLNLSTLTDTVTYESQCTTDEHCNLNGVCYQGTCLCDPGWKSSDCGALDLIPAPLKNGYNKTSTGTSSWGSKIIHRTPNSTTFDLFLAEFIQSCGLDYWSPYSRIIHAVSSTSPAGPYEFANEVVGTFSHNPTVVYSPFDREYLLYYIGCPYAPSDTCTAPSFTCGPGNFVNGESGISVASSPDLETWTSHGQVLSGTGDGAWDADVTNPSPFPLYSPHHPTGEIVLAYRGCPYNCSRSELIGLATSLSFLGPYTKVQQSPLFPNGNEDPFLWRDKRGNFHLLLHSLEAGGGFGDGPKVGRHAYSTTLEGPWIFNDRTLAFDTTVDFEDGSSVAYFRRERPQLFFSEDGEMAPLYLTTGVQEGGKAGSYSVIQPLRGAREYERSLRLAL